LGGKIFEEDRSGPKNKLSLRRQVKKAFFKEKGF